MSYKSFKLTEQQEVKAAGGHLEQVQSAIHKQLTVAQGGIEADGELAEFITVMLNNQKNLSEIEEQIVELLAVDEGMQAAAAETLCTWLERYLKADIQKRSAPVSSTDKSEGSAARLAKRLLGVLDAISTAAVRGRGT